LNVYLAGMIAVLLIAATVIFGGFAQYILTIASFTIMALAVLAWFNNVSNRQIEKLEKVKKPGEPTIKVDEEAFEGLEFHNDFSKVPAGEPDLIAPPPRSIGYGYGDNGRSVMEDLERIGIKTTEEKPAKKKNILE
jgi:hypothetical protein